MNLGSSDSRGAAVVPFLDLEDEELAVSATTAGAMAVVISPAGHSATPPRRQAVDSAGCWSLFGGAVEQGEAPDDTVVRELEEELGLTELEIRPLWRVVDKGGDGRVVTIFEARTSLSPDQMTLSEGQGLEAFELDEALHRKLAPFCRRVLTRLAADRSAHGIYAG